MTELTADVVVAGAGHNSLVAAAYLAEAGLEVCVLEARDVVGGNTVTEELTLPGFAHDSCSSAHVLIQSNPLLRDDELGLLGRYGLRYVFTDPAVVFTRADGHAVVMHRDRDRTAAELGRHHAPDADAFRALLADWEAGLAASHGRWNAGILDSAGSPADAAYAELRRRSAWDVVRERFAGDAARELLMWLSFATIQDPFRAGTGALPFAITAGRTAYGWATPLGGSGALPDALVRHIVDHGGTVLTGRPVERVEVHNGRAAAVVTADGARFAARRAVLSTVHLTQLPALLDGAPVPAELAREVAAWRPGLSLFAVHLALRADVRYRTAEGPMAAVAGGLGSVAGQRRQLERFAAGQVDATDPWLLVVSSTVVDPARAPEGATLKLLTVAPYTLADGRDWETAAPEYAEALVEHVAGRVDGLDGGDILAVVPESPSSLARRNRHNVGGSCHGGELAADGEVRPGITHRLPVPGLYQTGATSHPGGSVSGRAGRNAARALLGDLGIDPGRVMGPT